MLVAVVLFGGGVVGADLDGDGVVGGVEGGVGVVIANVVDVPVVVVVT